MQNNNLIRTEFSVRTEWEQGFTGRLDIFNQGESIEDWTIEFESASEIEPGAIWGAEIVSREGNIYTLKPVDYNEVIESNREVSIFFNANKIDGKIINPSNIVLNHDNLDSAIATTEPTTPEAEIITDTNEDIPTNNLDTSAESITTETTEETPTDNIDDSVGSTVAETTEAEIDAVKAVKAVIRL